MTERSLTAGLKSAIQAPVVRPVLIYEGEFANAAFVRLWTGIGPLAFNGETFTGGGQLLGISPIGENVELRAEGFQVRLSGMPTDKISLALQSLRQGKPGKLWLGAMREEAYLELPGVAGNYASTPDNAAFAFPGDVEWEMWWALEDWTPADLNALAAQFHAQDPGNGGSWRIYINASGRVQLSFTRDNSTFQNPQSTVSPTVQNNELLGLKIIYDNDQEVTFLTADNIDNPNWVQLGAPVSITGSGALFDSAFDIELGARNSGETNPANGRLHKFIMRNGIDGPIVSKFDPLRFKSGELTAVMETGETWTVHQSGSPAARIVPAGDVLIADPYLLQQGKLDIGIIEDNGETCTIAVTYEGRLIDLERPRESRYTHEDQQRFFPGDKGFDQVEALQDRELTWSV